MPSQPSRTLDTFPNPAPERDYLIHIEVPEFTCLCPLTGQPDFATIEIDYISDKRNVELRALKGYMWSYRDEGAFHEACTNKILADLIDVCEPRFIRVTARWYVRGGIFTTVRAEHCAPGFVVQPIVDLGQFESGRNVR